MDYTDLGPAMSESVRRDEITELRKDVIAIARCLVTSVNGMTPDAAMRERLRRIIERDF